MLLRKTKKLNIKYQDTFILNHLQYGKIELIIQNFYIYHRNENIRHSKLVDLIIDELLEITDHMTKYDLLSDVYGYGTYCGDFTTYAQGDYHAAYKYIIFLKKYYDIKNV